MSSSSSPARSAGYRPGPALHQRSYGSSSAVASSAYRKVGSARPTSYSAGLGSTDHFDLSQSTAVTNELKIIRTNEKEQLQGLNDRFVTFIDKVHMLEQQNKVLEAEVTLLRQRHSEPSRLHELYEQEIRELRSRVEELDHEKSQMQLDCVQMSDALEKLKEKLDEEVRMREEAEATLKGYRKDVDDATLTRLELEKKVESLLDEIAFLRKVHEEEVGELQISVQASQALSVTQLRALGPVNAAMVTGEQAAVLSQAQREALSDAVGVAVERAVVVVVKETGTAAPLKGGPWYFLLVQYPVMRAPKWFLGAIFAALTNYPST
ncbi:UNVERIFIED_CONTAM: hypothetical protein FKN15_014051 [Acipenser sinensis]